MIASKSERGLKRRGDRNQLVEHVIVLIMSMRARGRDSQSEECVKTRGRPRCSCIRRTCRALYVRGECWGQIESRFISENAQENEPPMEISLLQM